MASGLFNDGHPYQRTRRDRIYHPETDTVTLSQPGTQITLMADGSFADHASGGADRADRPA